MTRLKKSDEFGPLFKDIKTTAEPYPDLARISKQLMHEFFMRKDKPHVASYYK
jgi:hypothetical protein